MRFFILLLVVAFCCDARHVPKDGVFAVAETLPEYGGGEGELDSTLRSHIELRNPEIQGTVFVSFVVDSTGSIGKYKVVRSDDRQLDSIAIEVIRSLPAKWSAGTFDGRPVNVKMVYPVRFE